MKFLQILILSAFILSFMPLDAFCEDHHETTEHHHGIVICHGSCHGAVLANQVAVDLCETITSFEFIQDLSYEGPTLPIEARPPIFLS